MYTHTQRADHVKTQGEDAHLHTRVGGLREPALPTSWPQTSSLLNGVRKQISIFEATQSGALHCGSSRKLVSLDI